MRNTAENPADLCRAANCFMHISNSGKTIKEAFWRQWRATVTRIMGILSPAVKASKSPGDYACSLTLQPSGNGVSDTELEENWSCVPSHLPGVAEQGAREGPALWGHHGRFWDTPTGMQSATNFQGHLSSSSLLTAAQRHEPASI